MIFSRSIQYVVVFDHWRIFIHVWHIVALYFCLFINKILLLILSPKKKNLYFEESIYNSITMNQLRMLGSHAQFFQLLIGILVFFFNVISLSSLLEGMYSQCYVSLEVNFFFKSTIYIQCLCISYVFEGQML